MHMCRGPRDVGVTAKQPIRQEVSVIEDGELMINLALAVENRPLVQSWNAFLRTLKTAVKSVTTKSDITPD